MKIEEGLFIKRFPQFTNLKKTLKIKTSKVLLYFYFTI